MWTLTTKWSQVSEPSPSNFRAWKITYFVYPSRIASHRSRRYARRRLLASRRLVRRAATILSGTFSASGDADSIAGRHQQRRRAQRARLRFARHVHSDDAEPGPTQRRRHRRHPASAEQYGKRTNGTFGMRAWLHLCVSGHFLCVLVPVVGSVEKCVSFDNIFSDKMNSHGRTLPTLYRKPSTWRASSTICCSSLSSSSSC